MNKSLIRTIEDAAIQNASTVIRLLSINFPTYVFKTDYKPQVTYRDGHYIAEFETLSLGRLSKKQRRKIQSFIKSEFEIRQPQYTKLGATFFMILKVNHPSGSTSILTSFEI